MKMELIIISKFIIIVAVLIKELMKLRKKKEMKEKIKKENSKKVKEVQGNLLLNQIMIKVKNEDDYHDDYYYLLY